MENRLGEQQRGELGLFSLEEPEGKPPFPKAPEPGRWSNPHPLTAFTRDRWEARFSARPGGAREGLGGLTPEGSCLLRAGRAAPAAHRSAPRPARLARGTAVRHVRRLRGRSRQRRPRGGVGWRRLRCPWLEAVGLPLSGTAGARRSPAWPQNEQAQSCRCTHAGPGCLSAFGLSAALALLTRRLKAAGIGSAGAKKGSAQGSRSAAYVPRERQLSVR